jgi:short-subunit dehydrogenase
MHIAITGASSGIGEALARELARAWGKSGAKLSLIARRAELMEAYAGSLGVPTFIRSVDLLDTESCTNWIAEAETKHGPIDVLVNNAGIQIVNHCDLTSPEEGEQVIRLCLTTPLRLIRAVLPGMMARRSGVLVDISSMAGLVPTPYMFYYNAAKAGLGAASEGLRAEVAPHGVHVLTVYPGPVKTPMADAAFAKMGGNADWVPTGTTAQLARLIRRAIERRRPRLIYPRFYALSRFMPGVARIFADRMTPPLPRP